MMITVYYSSIDRCRITREFTTLEAAREFAHKYVGAHPERGQNYAVSKDGVGRVEVTGCSFYDLFPRKQF